MSKTAVQHFKSGRDAWKIGFVGFFSRLRGIILASLVTLLTMGAPWWWPANIQSTVTIDLKWLVLVVALVTGGLIVAGFYYLRRRSIRSLEIKYCLHHIAHEIRDRQTALHKRLDGTKKYSVGKLNKDLELLLKDVANSISHHFQLLTGDQTICAAIRLVRYEKSDKKLYYRTYARSKGLNPHRSKHSEDTPADRGIPRYLAEKGTSQGVLVYNDLDEAADNNTYLKTKNDEKYPEDIVTMMVAPLNAWSGGKESVIGILYVTSRRKDTFRPIHVDSVAFSADLTALAVANAFEIVKANSKIQTLEKVSSNA